MGKQIKTNPFTFITLSWLTPLLKQGKQTPLTSKDLYELDGKNTSKEILLKFNSNGKRFCWCLLDAVKIPLMGSFICSFAGELFAIYTPQALEQLIQYLAGSTNSSTNGLYLVIILFLFQALGAILDNLGQIIFRRVAQITTSLTTGAIYEKILKLNCQSREVIYSVYLLRQLIGNSIWPGIGLFILILIISLSSGPAVGRGFNNWFEKADKRISILREMLYGIKIVKYLAMEDYFANQINQVRKEQVYSIYKLNLLLGGVQGLTDIAPMLMALVTFAVYVSLGNPMSPAIIFPALSYMAVITDPIMAFQAIVYSTVTGTKSLQRIQDFLLAKEVDLPPFEKDINTAITLRNATFKWQESVEKETFQLSGLEIAIPKGKLVGVVGRIGSGKSTLFSGLIGESLCTNGSFIVNGKLCYSSQTPWILTGSIEKNILFNQPLDLYKLEKVLYCSGLKNDLDNLPNGIKTEIGENGVNLSGGQRARLSLARSLYADGDVYLLDDPLAALDSQVGRQVFQEAVKTYLGGKTVLFATHQLQYLQQVDEIIVLENGKVAEYGTFDDLKDNPDGALSKMLESFDFNQSESTTETNEDTKSIDTTFKDVKEFMEEEDIQQGRVKFGIYWQYLKSLSLLPLTIALILYIGSLATQIALPLWLSKWSVDPTPDNHYYLNVYYALGAVFALTTTSNFWIFLFLSVFASAKYHDRAMKALFHAPVYFFERTPIGRILNRLSADVENVELNLMNVIQAAMFYFTQVLVAMVIVCQNSYWLILVLIVAGGLFYLEFTLFQPSARELKRIHSVRRSPLDSHITETLAGSSTIIAYNAQQDFIDIQRNLTDEYTVSFYLYRSVYIWFQWRVAVITSLITLALGLLGIYSKTYSPNLASSVGLALSFATRMSFSITFLMITWGSVESEFNSVERLHNYGFELDSEAPFELQTDPNSSVWPSKGQVVVKNLELRYPSRPDFAVIKNLSFQIHAGEKVGIVGRTGSGKSTLVSALLRIIEPTQGEMYIDNQDIAKLGLHTLRSNIAIIPQEPVLFEGTIRSNLDYSNKVSDDDLWIALEHSGLKVYVSSLEDKLDSKVTSNGENLSVGQRQLVCLARAILRKPKLMIMDEATASVDRESDELIQKAIKAFFSDTTILCIAHRLDTIADFDRVMVLSNGELVEFDTPTLLLKNRDSIFSQMAGATGLANSTLTREAQ